MKMTMTMMMMMMNIMVDNSETLLDGYMQTKPSLYAANQSLRTEVGSKCACFFRNSHFGKNVLVLSLSSAL